jgi:DNA-binding transcriptional ArsR family regulator
MSSSDRQELVFKALADGTRRRILDLLKDREQTTGALCAKLRGLDRCTVMQHLGVLERAQLIIVRREGRLRWNYLNAIPIKEVYDRWISRYAGPSLELLQRMQQDAELEAARRSISA